MRRHAGSPIIPDTIDADMRGRGVALRRATVRDISVALPATIKDDTEFRAELSEMKFGLLRRQTGVTARHIAAQNETALDLAEQACRALFARHPSLPGQLDTLMFCTQSADYPLPPNSCLLHGRLALSETIAAFDIPHACSAFTYALHLAQSLIASNAAANILLVTADTYSKFIHPADRSTRALFGDGATATWIAGRQDGGGVFDTACGTDGRHYDKFYVPTGGARNPSCGPASTSGFNASNGNTEAGTFIQMSGGDILGFVRSRIPDHIHAMLDRNDLVLDDVDWIVFHQASGVVLDTLTGILRADPGRVLRYLEPVGNLVSSSIPAVLRASMDAERFLPGQIILLCGFGAGLSWASTLLRW